MPMEITNVCKNLLTQFEKKTPLFENTKWEVGIKVGLLMIYFNGDM
jgi:hypothetical protein